MDGSFFDLGFGIGTILNYISKYVNSVLYFYFYLVVLEFIKEYSLHKSFRINMLKCEIYSL